MYFLFQRVLNYVYTGDYICITFISSLQNCKNVTLFNILLMSQKNYFKNKLRHTNEKKCLKYFKLKNII